MIPGGLPGLHGRGGKMLLQFGTPLVLHTQCDGVGQVHFEQFRCHLRFFQPVETVLFGCGKKHPEAFHFIHQLSALRGGRLHQKAEYNEQDYKQDEDDDRKNPGRIREQKHQYDEQHAGDEAHEG